MEQYIKKADIVAEIERLKNIYDDDEDIRNVSKYNILVDILSFLDTIEVEEVDLEQEIDDYMLPITAQDVKKEPFTQLEKCAKYFYELGLKAQKGE